MLFESTTKPQREAQKCLSDANSFNITGIFQQFSERTHNFDYKHADFWGSDFRGPFRSTKTVLKKTPCAGLQPQRFPSGSGILAAVL